MGSHKFSQETKEMFVNIVTKKDRDDCFLRQEGGASGGTIKNDRYCDPLKKI